MKWSDRLRNYIAPVMFSGVVAVCIFLFFLSSRAYLHGSAIYEQFYRIDLVSAAMKEGRLYPLYARGWYNGYEAFRCSAPGAYVTIGFLMRLFHADIHTSIAAFYALSAFLSTMGFSLFGIKQQRMRAAFAAGLAFLFLPPVVYVAVQQGCLDVVGGMSLLPALLYCVIAMIKRRQRWSLFPFSLLLCSLIWSNYVLAIAFGMILLIWLCCNVVFEHSWRYELVLVGNAALVYLLMGFLLYPALTGGLLTRGYTLQNDYGIHTGVLMLLMAAFGLMTADRDRATGFALTAIVLALSFDRLKIVLKLIPAVVLQEAYWYVIVVTVIFVVTLLCWRRLRLGFLLAALAVLAAESMAQMVVREVAQDETVVDSRVQADDYLLQEAADITANRVALFDDSALGSFPAWFFTEQGVDMMNGWDYENSYTASNIGNLDEAFADGFYEYVFDRLLLYGNDVVLVAKSAVPDRKDMETLILAAGDNLYELWDENDKVLLFKTSSVDGSYGVVTRYKNLAIGDSSAYIAFVYPSFGQGKSDVLEDYTVDELENYEILYLSGFTYRDKEKAENLLLELARKGVRIYIDMQHIPVNRLTGKEEFMGVYAQFIQFTESFPVLENDNGNQFKLDLRSDGYDFWNTVYISGCGEVLKETAYEEKSHLVYLGRNGEDNITFMGLNLIYNYLLTGNSDLRRFLDEMLDIPAIEELPGHVIVPLEVRREPSQIVVHADSDKVNSNIAGVETLVPDRIVEKEEGFWVVNEGDTIFRIVSAGQSGGRALAVFGLVGLVILWIAAYVLLENDTE